MSIKYNIRYTGGFHEALVKELPIDANLNLKEKMLQPLQKDLTSKEYSYKIIKCLRIFYDINNLDLDYIADDNLGQYFKEFIDRAGYIPEKNKLEVINFIKSSEEEMIKVRDKLISSNIEEIVIENDKIKILRKGEEVMIGGSWWFDYLLPLFIGVGLYVFFHGYSVGKRKKDKYNTLFDSLAKILHDQGYRTSQIFSFVSRNISNIESLFNDLPENVSSEEFRDNVLKLINDDEIAVSIIVETEAEEKRRQEELELEAEEKRREESLKYLLAEEEIKDEEAKRKKAEKAAKKARAKLIAEEQRLIARQKAKEAAERTKNEKAIRDLRSLIGKISKETISKSLEEVANLPTNIIIPSSSPIKQNDTPYVVENIPIELLQIIITKKVFGIILNLHNELLQIISSEISSKMWRQLIQSSQNDFNINIPKAWNFEFDEKIVYKTQQKRMEGRTSPYNFKEIIRVPNNTFSFKVKLPIKIDLEEINYLPRILYEELDINDYSYISWPQAFYPLTSEDLSFKPDEKGNITFYETFEKAEEQSFEFLYDTNYKFKISMLCSINDDSENILTQNYRKVQEKHIIPTEILVRIIKN